MDESIVDGNGRNDGLLDKWERYLLPTAEKALIDDELEVTLFDGLLHLRDDERYRNDDRYLKLWMRYADTTNDASKVFKMLKSYNIGMQLALFWAGWAYVLEKGESYSEAMGVLQQGKLRGARPASLLEEFEGAFCKRMRERMRVARSNLAQCAIEQKAVVPVIPKRPDATTPRSLTIREQPMDARIPLQSFPTSSRPLQDIRCSSGPDALSELADHRGMEARRVSGLCRSHIHHRVSCSKENPLTKTACRKELGADSEATTDTREEKSSESTDTPLRELDANTQYQEPRFRDPGKKARKEEKLLLIRDPFSQDMRKDLTVESPQYVRWLRSNNGIVHDVRDESLAKRWPRKTGTARRGSRHRIVSAQTLGAQRLEVMGMLGEGAFATVYACKVDARYDVAVKIELQKCTALSLSWECFVTLQLRDRLLHRCDAEHTPIQPEIEVIAPTALHLFSDGSAMTMPQGRYGTVHDLVIMYQKNSQAMPQLVVMHYATQMLRFCRAMHSVSILHLDIKPDNWLLTTSKRGECGMHMNHPKTGGDGRRSSHSLSLIDFGRAIDLSVFPDNGSAVSFTGKCCPSNFSCPAMFEGRMWKYDADLFALGSCIYFMLHGAYLEVDCYESQGSDSASSERRRRWRPKRQCRRYWEVNLWNYLFDELLNSDGCGNGHAKTEAILIRLEQSISTFIMDGRRSLELAEFLRIQDNMFRCNS